MIDDIFKDKTREGIVSCWKMQIVETSVRSLGLAVFFDIADAFKCVREVPGRTVINPCLEIPTFCIVPIADVSPDAYPGYWIQIRFGLSHISGVQVQQVFTEELHAQAFRMLAHMKRDMIEMLKELFERRQAVGRVQS